MLRTGVIRYMEDRMEALSYGTRNRKIVKISTQRSVMRRHLLSPPMTGPLLVPLCSLLHVQPRGCYSEETEPGAPAHRHHKNQVRGPKIRNSIENLPTEQGSPLALCPDPRDKRGV